MKQKAIVVKIGGNLIEDETLLKNVLENFNKITHPKILIHGGGKKATEIAQKLGITTKMVNGRRITNKDNLEVITMVYGGLVNKQIVVQLQALNCNALGVSGADLNSITATKRPVKEHDYGFVGDVTHVNSTMFSLLLKNEITPVCCAITHNGNGQLFNTNADTIASEIAIALTQEYNVELYYCFEKKGVLENIENENSVIEHINQHHYKYLLSEHIIADGMLPKLQNAFNALQYKVEKVYIGSSDALINNKMVKTTLTL